MLWDTARPRAVGRRRSRQSLGHCQAAIPIASVAYARLMVVPPPSYLSRNPRYPFFFLSAHLAFIIADNFFRAAALIGGRPVDFFEAAFLGADLPFHCAHRCFIAAEIRLRAAGLIVRRLRLGAGAGAGAGAA